MSYKCDVCRRNAEQGQKRLTHRVHRSDGSLEREVLLCPKCYDILRQLRGEEAYLPSVARRIADDVIASFDAHGCFPPPSCG